MPTPVVSSTVCQSGSILVTTRSRDAALKLVEQSNVIAVEPMNKDNALALLEKKLGEQDDINSLTELAAALEFMPLAIVQAAAYISQRAPRCSVQQYLENFQKSDLEKMSLLDREGGQLRRDREAKNSIIITWQISFDHILRTRPSAADLLSLMSYFDRQGIQEVLLRNRTEVRKPREHRHVKHVQAILYLKRLFERERRSRRSQEEHVVHRKHDDGFEDDVLTLRNYSFISVNEDTKSFEMHSLVQLVTRTWLEAHGERERWKHQFILSLSSEFPTGEYENWATCQALFPHVKLAAAQKPEGQESVKMWAIILYRAAWYAMTVFYRPDIYFIQRPEVMPRLRVQ